MRTTAFCTSEPVTEVVSKWDILSSCTQLPGFGVRSRASTLWERIAETVSTASPLQILLPAAKTRTYWVRSTLTVFGIPTALHGPTEGKCWPRILDTIILNPCI